MDALVSFVFVLLPFLGIVVFAYLRWIFWPCPQCGWPFRLTWLGVHWLTPFCVHCVPPCGERSGSRMPSHLLAMSFSLSRRIECSGWYHPQRYHPQTPGIIPRHPSFGYHPQTPGIIPHTHHSRQYSPRRTCNASLSREAPDGRGPRWTGNACAVNRVRCWSSVGANPTRQLGRSSR